MILLSSFKSSDIEILFCPQHFSRSTILVLCSSLGLISPLSFIMSWLHLYILHVAIPCPTQDCSFVQLQGAPLHPSLWECHPPELCNAQAMSLCSNWSWPLSLVATQHVRLYIGHFHLDVPSSLPLCVWKVIIPFYLSD